MGAGVLCTARQSGPLAEENAYAVAKTLPPLLRGGLLQPARPTQISYILGC
jgi:hypothetical protein